MGRKYEKLEGKEVKVLGTSHGDVDCIVTGADWNLGITIQTKEDHAYIVCLNGPKSPVVKGKFINPKAYKKAMAFVYDTVMSKKPIHVHDLILVLYHTTVYGGSPPSAESCAFSQ